MTNVHAASLTVLSPCDLYGHTARQLHNAISSIGGRWTIEKPQENRACDASSLLGLLRLGVHKGDTIRFVGESDVQNPEALVSALRAL